jgi:cell fate (sporulation/competence/biofilm development) regulator YlbF (YheA/YmcA/DUF963 family)
MDIIEMARNIGREIQKDSRYADMQEAIKKTDADAALQDLIGKFNLKRMTIEEEAKKQEHDNDKMQGYQNEMNALYDKIIKNENMAAYGRAKSELEKLVQRVSAIIVQSANGGDPETADYTPSSCGGNCSSCGGCH